MSSPMDPRVDSWSAMARRAAGEKVRNSVGNTHADFTGSNSSQVVQIRPHTWITEVTARRAGLKIVHQDGVWMTARYARALEKGQSALERLPAELRGLILSFVQVRASHAVFLRGNANGPPSGIIFPPIAYVSTVMRAQFIALSIETTTYVVHSGPGNAAFQSWLKGTDLTCASTTYKNGFDAVKSLTFAYFSRFHHQSMAVSAPNNDFEMMLNVEYLRRQYRLDRMLKLGNLERLVLTKRNVHGDRVDVLENLAAWFRSNIKDKRGKAPEVMIV
ncbi:hypothetical protein LTR53_000945 [Teratosphaeriaceae sp. CCFEE 6253]|nr:hypothetical protein LTR53_000945 [Teratosphaeriaceae sp. CCFEE 6253]